MPQKAARAASLIQTKELLPANLIVGFDGTNAQAAALAEFTRVASLDGFYLVGVQGNNPGDPVGSATHSHTAPHTHASPGTHTHGWTPLFLGGYCGNFGYDYMSAYVVAHTHPGVSGASAMTVGADGPTSGATAIDPLHYTVIWIEATVDATLPANTLVWSTTNAVPAGWTLHSPSNARFWKGANAGANAGGTGGVGSHTHTDPTPHTHPIPHTHTAAPVGNSPGATAPYPEGPGPCTGNANVVPNVHSHSPATLAGNPVTTTSATASSFGSATVEPNHLQLLAYEGSAVGVPLFSGMIVATLLSPVNVPPGWSICDGTNGTPDLRNRLAKVTNTPGNVGVTGGSTTHTHSYASHGHTATHTHPGNSGPGTGPAIIGQTTYAWSWVNNHSHPYAPATAPVANASATSQAASSFPASKAVLFLRKD